MIKYSSGYVVVFFFLIILLTACSETEISGTQQFPPADPAITEPSEPIVATSTTTATEVVHEPTPTPDPTATATPQSPLGIGSTQYSAIDGMEMVYVPAGVFIMGSSSRTAYEICSLDDESQECHKSYYFDEEPEHKVYLDPFWIDKTEVTTGMYQQCVEAGVCSEPNIHTFYSDLHYYGDPSFNDYPVISVSKPQAETYCLWAGRNLPTEAQWEKAARGTDARLFAWGNELPNNTLASFKRSMVMGCFEPVNRFEEGVSPYGALNMTGNATEWVLDFYDDDYYSISPKFNPSGPPSGYNIHRGGSCWNYPENLLTFFRDYDGGSDDNPNIDAGFRCAMQAPVAEIVAPELTREMMITLPAMTGEDVLILQKRLLELGYFMLGEANGKYGKTTENAIKHFQELNGLEVDGVVGVKTWTKLFSKEAEISD